MEEPHLCPAGSQQGGAEAIQVCPLPAKAAKHILHSVPSTTLYSCVLRSSNLSPNLALRLNKVRGPTCCIAWSD